MFSREKFFEKCLEFWFSLFKLTIKETVYSLGDKNALSYLIDSFIIITDRLTMRYFTTESNINYKSLTLSYFIVWLNPTSLFWVRNHSKSHYRINKAFLDWFILNFEKYMPNVFLIYFMCKYAHKPFAVIVPRFMHPGSHVKLGWTTLG